MINIYPKLEEKINLLIQKMSSLGFKVKVVSGYRSIEEQDKLYKIGRYGDKRKIVTNAMGGSSYHNYGLAVDLCFVKNEDLSWDESNNWELLGKEGKSLGLEWGGDFKSFKDRPHFQISNGIKLSVLKQKIKTNSLQDVWNFVSKQGGLHDKSIK